MSEWQPIETAPQDDDVLLWDGRYISLGEHCWDEEGGPVFLSGSDVIRWPTHWMPLPAPPQEQE